VVIIYDPLTDELIPWLAEEGKWVSANVYKLTLRKGLTWQGGKPLTAENVKFAFELTKKITSIYYSTIWECWRPSKWLTRRPFTSNFPIHVGSVKSIVSGMDKTK